VHGVWTDRWSTSRELERAAARLGEEMPGDLGPWKAEAIELDPGALRAAGAVGHWARVYKHGRTGESVTVLLLCGRPGRISVHRPEHCYRSAGYEMLTAPAPYRLREAAPLTLASPPSDGGEARVRGALGEFRVALFRKQEADGLTQLRILWSWFAGDGWSAPDEPRLTFARYPALYKLYVIRTVPETGEGTDDDPMPDLLRRLMPELTRALTTP
jgi:hypothetical protein